VFENRVVRVIFGPKRDEVVGGWRRLHEERYNLYALPSLVGMIKLRRMRCAEQVARMIDANAYRILVAKPEGKILLVRHRCSLEDYIKMDLRQICWEGVNGFICLWIGTNEL
jgi:hypothetical protein